MGITRYFTVREVDISIVVPADILQFNIEKRSGLLRKTAQQAFPLQ
ncbi:hypothetical protein UXO42_06235 [Enterobacter quasihormaechei]